MLFYIDHNSFHLNKLQEFRFPMDFCKMVNANRLLTFGGRKFAWLASRQAGKRFSCMCHLPPSTQQKAAGKKAIKSLATIEISPNFFAARSPASPCR